jgi:hypothetical protein
LPDVWQIPVRPSPSSGGDARPGRALGQDAELIAPGARERDPAAVIGPPVTGELRRTQCEDPC